MKRIVKIVVIASIGILFLECEKNDIKFYSTEGFIIGFDPCEGGTLTSKRGLIIACNNFEDTLVAYNLPDSIFVFPQKLFANYINSCLFPDSEYLNYKIKFQYRFANKNEKQYPLCLANIYTWEFDHYVRDRQIILNEVTNINPKK